MRNAPEKLAVRAVNQYRRRDVIGYLGLRLYLESVCAARDEWGKTVATRLALGDHAPVYHSSLNFKERNEQTGTIEYRRLCIPTPNEIVAETALLAECAKAGEAFSTFSLDSSKDKENFETRNHNWMRSFVGLVSVDPQ